ncbi:MAG: peptidyl-prolyl cis-trans isomerase SurA [Paracoccaceae bacterium]|jgi:peptidyl-prolyl cis-trans isomerase SurA
MRKILNALPHRSIRLPKTRASALRFCGVLSLIILAAMQPQLAQAQSLFSPALTVNEDVITHFELDQRAKFMAILRAPGDPAKLAHDALIEDRLKQQAIKQAGFETSPEDVEAGIEEFAARAKLKPDEFVKALEQAGVSRETLRDFVEIGISWREYVSARFLAQARPTEAEIDLAIGRSGSGGVQVLLSELIIPITLETQEQVEGLAAEIAQVKGYDAFSAAAAQNSAAETRVNGGRLDWLSITELPAGLRPVILELAPGEITAPITLPQAVALFQMRGVRESGVAAPRYASIEYATFFLAGGRTPETLAAAAGIADRIDTCDDLYGIVKKTPGTTLERVSKAPGQIPRDVALELAKLDEGETSIALTRSNGQSLMLLMLCGRTAGQGDEEARQEISDALTQQRLNTFAANFLEQMRADALIIEQ